MPADLTPPHISNALIRRGAHPGIMMQQQNPLAQVSPGSPNFQPEMQTPPQAPMPEQSPMDGMQHQFAQTAMQGQDPSAGVMPQGVPQDPQAGMGMPAPDPTAPQSPLEAEQQLILNTLVKRLDSHTKKGQKEHDMAMKFVESMLPQQEGANGQPGQ